MGEKKKNLEDMTNEGYLHEFLFQLLNVACLHFTNDLISDENWCPEVQSLLHINNPWLDIDAIIINQAHVQRYIAYRD